MRPSTLLEVPRAAGAVLELPSAGRARELCFWRLCVLLVPNVVAVFLIVAINIVFILRVIDIVIVIVATPIFITFFLGVLSVRSRADIASGGKMGQAF
jgi:hypothetical protein